MASSPVGVVYVEIVSSSWNKDAIILKLKAIHRESRFDRWVKPTKPSVATDKSGIDGLKCRGFELFIGNQPLQTKPLVTVLLDFLAFLKSCGPQVLLVSHGAGLRFMLLLKAIEKTGMVDEFDGVIKGYSDSLPIIQEKNPSRKGPKQFTLFALVRDFLGRERMRIFKPSNALENFILLVSKLKLLPELMKKSTSYETLLDKAGIHKNNQFDRQAGPSRRLSTVQSRRERLPSVVSRRENESDHAELNFSRQDWAALEEDNSDELHFSKQDRAAVEEDNYAGLDFSRQDPALLEEGDHTELDFSRQGPASFEEDDLAELDFSRRNKLPPVVRPRQNESDYAELNFSGRDRALENDFDFL